MCKRLAFHQHIHKKLQTRFNRIVEIIDRIATGFYLVKDVEDGFEFKMSIDFLHPLPETWNKEETLKFMADVQQDYIKMMSWENLFEE